MSKKKFDPLKVYFIAGILLPGFQPASDKDGAEIGYHGIGSAPIPRNLLEDTISRMRIGGANRNTQSRKAWLQHLSSEEFMRECIKYNEYVEFEDIEP